MYSKMILRLSHRLHLCALLLLFSASSVEARNDQAPQTERDEFHFIVLGDAQFDDTTGFNRIIDQVRRLYPAFVIQVGDLIDGYDSDLGLIQAEWRRFQHQISPIADIPYYAIAGNHDVYGGNKQPDAGLERIFEDTWGPLYFSFTYKNALFIGLNSDSKEAPASVSDEQLQWMSAILAKSDAQHKFVFMHRPPMQMKNAAVLHQLFIQGGVQQVIYGHHHHLHHFERDGVHYTMTNAGGRMAHKVKAVGGFAHFLHIAVRGNTSSVAVIEADSVHAQDMVDPSDNYDLYNLGRSLVRREATLMPKGRPGRYTFSLDLNNTTQRELTALIDCNSPDQRWHLSPKRIQPVSISPDNKQTIAIAATYEPSRVPEGTPACTVKVPFQTQSGQWLEFTEQVRTRR